MTITIMEKEFENQISAGKWVHNNCEPTDNYNVYAERDDKIIVALQYIVEEAEDSFEDFTAYVEYCFSEKMYNETEFSSLPWETSIWGVTLQYHVVQEFRDEEED
jgi:hypothetical protein